MSAAPPLEFGQHVQVLVPSIAETSTASINPVRGRYQRIEPYLLVKSRDEASKKAWTPWCLSRGKRIFDIVGASLLLAVISPFLLLCAVGIKLTSPGPVFFRQWRTGLAGRRFRIFKFRTMRPDAERMKVELRALNHHAPDSPDFKIKNDPRVTSVGKLLRRTSLDELPNLLNVVLGDMSLVGPRPTSFDIDAYADWHLARLAVPPGMTGLWQISGRSELDFDDRVQLDCQYIREQSLLTDLKILALTPASVLGGRGAC